MRTEPMIPADVQAAFERLRERFEGTGYAGDPIVDLALVRAHVAARAQAPAPAAVQEAGERLTKVMQLLADKDYWYEEFGGQLGPLLAESIDADLAILLAAAQDGARARVAAIEECAQAADSFTLKPKLSPSENAVMRAFACRLRALLPPPEAGPR